MRSSLRALLPRGEFRRVKRTTSSRMSAIRGRHNKSTERRLRASLVGKGISGWTMDTASIPGHPDFVFSREGIAIFVDGCFWHGCPNCCHIPSTRTEFWAAKISGNQRRDRTTTASLRRKGYRVLRFWEHMVQSDIARVLDAIQLAKESRRASRERRRRRTRLGRR